MKLLFNLIALSLSTYAVAATSSAEGHSLRQGSRVESDSSVRVPSIDLMPEEKADNTRRLQDDPMVTYVGNNGNFDVFPLELCMGDCDDDSDCADGLMCFQRNARTAVPGCSGGEADTSGSDYCVGNPATRMDTEEEDMGLGNKVKITVTNEAFQQPFSPIFIMTHNEEETPIFQIGKEPTEALAILAEDGDPSLLIEQYNNSANAGYVGALMEGIPVFLGDSVEFMVPFNPKYPYLTIASMAINTNDCFVALRGVKLQPKAVFESPGFDAGSEKNNELCESIPGPACAMTTGNVRSGDGEGFVHVHRGFFGIGPELSQVGYDWRNPMMRVEMEM